MVKLSNLIDDIATVGIYGFTSHSRIGFGSSMNIVRCAFVVALLTVAVTSGCNSGRYPAHGVVHYPDGSPVEAGTVIAEARVNGEIVGVQANIEKDGSFKLGGAVPGDGALPGNYRAMVMPVTLGDSEIAAGMTPAVAGKYANIETSGIAFEIKAEENKLDIEVTKPK